MNVTKNWPKKAHPAFCITAKNSSDHPKSIYLIDCCYTRHVCKTVDRTNCKQQCSAM